MLWLPWGIIQRKVEKNTKLGQKQTSHRAEAEAWELTEAGMMLETAVLAFILFNFSISTIKPGGLEEGLMYAIIVELSPIFFSLKKIWFRLVISVCYSQGRGTLIALGNMSEKY